MSVWGTWLATLVLLPAVAVAAFGVVFLVAARGRDAKVRQAWIGVAFLVGLALLLLFNAVKEPDAVALWIPLTVTAVGLIAGTVAGVDAWRRRTRRSPAE